jgi:hypothetical protein
MLWLAKGLNLGFFVFVVFSVVMVSHLLLFVIVEIVLTIGLTAG